MACHIPSEPPTPADKEVPSLHGAGAPFTRSPPVGRPRLPPMASSHASTPSTQDNEHGPSALDLLAGVVEQSQLNTNSPVGGSTNPEHDTDHADNLYDDSLEDPSLSSPQLPSGPATLASAEQLMVPGALPLGGRVLRKCVTTINVSF